MYFVALVESFIFQSILWGINDINYELLLILVVGLIFSIICLLSANAQFLYYRIWVQYASVPFSLLMFLIPILSIYHKTFIINNIMLLMLIWILFGIFFIFLVIIKFDSENSIESMMKLVKGYGELND